MTLKSDNLDTNCTQQCMHYIVLSSTAITRLPPEVPVLKEADSECKIQPNHHTSMIATCRLSDEPIHLALVSSTARSACSCTKTDQ